MTEPRNRIREIVESEWPSEDPHDSYWAACEVKEYAERVARRVLAEALPIAARYFFDEPGPHDILSFDDALRAHFGLGDGNQ